MARLGLARHVFVCRDEDYIVVLDLKQDRYFALEAAPTAPLSVVLPGWPAPAPDGVLSDSAIAAAAPLVRRGWLLEEGAESKEATPVRNAVPEGDLTGEADGADEKLGLGTVAAFVTASLFAKFALRFWPFERVIRRVAQRRARRAEVVSESFDFERARKLVYAFTRMRAFLFSTRDECLHDSLAILEFLARHQLFPSWVFAVRARPFAAHCWVQHDGLVFNDTVEHVSSYVPIMVV
jgi:transglutaminase superfamily protein